MLSLGSRDQLYSPPAILLQSWVFTVLVYLGLVSLPHPLSLGQNQRSISQLPAVSVLWWFADCFQFCSIIWLWMLLPGSGDELCGPISGSGLSSTCCQPSACPVFVCQKFRWRSASCSSPLLQWTYSILPLCCVFLLSSLFSILFLLESVCLGGCAALSQEWLWEYHMTLGAHLLVCWMSPK
jgi:hypothetical protein